MLSPLCVSLSFSFLRFLLSLHERAVVRLFLPSRARTFRCGGDELGERQDSRQCRGEGRGGERVSPLQACVEKRAQRCVLAPSCVFLILLCAEGVFSPFMTLLISFHPRPFFVHFVAVKREEVIVSPL